MKTGRSRSDPLNNGDPTGPLRRLLAVSPKWAFGKVLREYRERKEMSQEHLAEAVGLDRSFLSMVERGIQSPNIVVLIKIADVLEVPAAELIARMESTIQDK